MRCCASTRSSRISRTGAVAPVNRFTGDELRDFTSDSYITLSDPWNRVPFAIVADGAVYPGTPVGGGAAIPVDPSIKANRLLTGSDFDIESIRRAPMARCGSAMSSART